MKKDLRMGQLEGSNQNRWMIVDDDDDDGDVYLDRLQQGFLKIISQMNCLD
jgi:hypothetical protein